MYNNSIEKAVDGIVFSNDTKKRIWNNITNTHKVNSRHYMKFSVAISIVCLLLIFCANTALNSKTLITVYAMDKTGQNDSIVLSPNDQVELLEQNTSVGTGYVFILTIPDNYTYDCIAIDEEENIFSVYQNQNYIYWIPNNEILEYPDVRPAGGLKGHGGKRSPGSFYSPYESPEWGNLCECKRTGV